MADTATPVEFRITQYIRDNYPDIIMLVLGSSSMDDAERQYWFDTLPTMSADHVERLRDILLTEKRRLAEINVKYEETLRQLGDGRLAEWQAQQEANQRRINGAQEQIQRQQDQRTNDDLMRQLDAA